MMWGLCFLCVAGGFTAVHGAPAGRPRKTEDKAAPQEEVNVLMFGVIQLSESLNYVYENTEAKIAKISQTVRGHEGALRQLGAQTEQAAEVERQMREVIRLLQVRRLTEEIRVETVIKEVCSGCKPGNRHQTLLTCDPTSETGTGITRADALLTGPGGHATGSDQDR